MIIRALLLFLLCFYSAPSFANEILYFKESVSYKDRLVTSFLDKHLKQEDLPYLIAKSDLNDDVIDEYIVKLDSPISCPSADFCPHYIVALHKYKPVLIGAFNAHKIVVKNNNTYGVRHLQIYNNKNNNFTSSVAYWDPFSSQFKIKQR